MCVFEQSCYFNPALLTVVLMLHICLSTSTPPTTHETPPKTCGTVHTSTGKNVTLRQGVPLTSEQFNDVRNITLKNSFFSPANGCAIQVCGFMSWGTLKEEGYIGSTSDYTDCLQFTKEESGEDVFYEPFYMSSIECGCRTPSSKCTSTCTDSRTKSWDTNDCAVLYEERDCNECYFPHTRLSANDTYMTDNTHHVMSMAVRPECRVYQYSPGMKKMFWFKDTAQPIVYAYDPEQYDVVSSSFLGEVETFVCECGRVGAPGLGHAPGGGGSEKRGWVVSVVAGVGVLLAVVVVVYVFRGKLVSKLSGVLKVIRWGNMEEYTRTSESVESGTRQGSVDEVITTTSNHKLEEKLDDVKKLLELLCGCSSTQIKPLRNEEAVATVSEQFKLVCYPENVVCRDSVLYSEASCLGSGQFGTVYKGLVTQNDGLRENVAVKVVKWDKMTDEHVKSFLREVKTYQDVGGCEFIVMFVGGCVHDDGLFLLTQFCEGGSLEDYLVTLRPREYVECIKQLGDGYTVNESEKSVEESDDEVVRELVKFSYRIACGMEWLEGRGVVHGDLAVRNVLLGGDKCVKICDFGLSRKCCGGEYVVGNLSKFPYNSLAPEVCKCEDDAYKLSSSVDVWAYGCTLFEIFTFGRSVYEHVGGEGVEKVVEVMRLLVFEGFRHGRVGGMGGDVYEKVKECWDEEPANRPSFSELRRFFGGKCL